VTLNALNKLILAVAFPLVFEHTAFFLEGTDFLADVPLSATIVTADKCAMFREESSSRTMDRGRAVNLNDALVFMD